MKKILYLFLGFSLLTILLLQVDFQSVKGNGGCPFCPGVILERQLFLREGTALGILTHKPAVPGHVLIIPERHVERFEDLTAGEMADIQRAIQKIHRFLGTGDYLLLQKSGRSVGQSVPHLHFHYIPAGRFLALRFLLAPWLKPLTAGEMEKVKEVIGQAGLRPETP